MLPMIKLGLKLPVEDFYVACSGGADSMAVVDFLVRGKRRPRLAYMDHGTGHSANAEACVRQYAEHNSLSVTVGRLSRERQPRESPEEFWREERYRFLRSLQITVLMAHHLDDAVEQWLFSSLHGNPNVIPCRNGNVVRPFLLTSKEELLDWCAGHNVGYVEDPSNKDLSYMRNRVRHRIVPEALAVNPGLRKVVARIVREAYGRERADVPSQFLNPRGNRTRVAALNPR